MLTTLRGMALAEVCFIGLRNLDYYYFRITVLCSSVIIRLTHANE